ncbi:hypothetical protein R50073_27510 [Maricurvus nonylphenolicus]|uniref:flagellar assembly protein FliH n=1 Tax=Maricurvus nonylphenolicus TaxID=1008307 RepID=UPI0036F35917
MTTTEQKKSGHAVNRIPEEDTGAFQRWSLPEMDEFGNIIEAEKRPEPKPRKVAEKAPGAVTESGEVIEDIDAADITMQPITAEHLQEITEAAEKEGFAKGHQEGFAQGKQEGNQQGYQEGLQKAKQETDVQLRQKVQQLQQITNQLMVPFKEQESQLYLMLLDFVCALTRKIIKRELQIDSGDILAVVKQAVAALPVGAKSLRLTLNPDDLAMIESYAEEKQLGWQFYGDAGLTPGGCHIETAESQVDYSVESQMDALLEEFLTRQLSQTSNLDPDQNPTPQLDQEVLSAPVELTPSTVAAEVSEHGQAELNDTASDDFPDSPRNDPAPGNDLSPGNKEESP